MQSLLQARNTRKSKWRIPGGNSSPNRASIISSKGKKLWHSTRRKKTSNAWHCKTNQTDDPNPPEKKKSPVPAQSPQLALPPGPSKPTVTPKRNTATAPRASSAPHKKKSRSDSAAATQCDNKREIIDLNRLLRESNSDLESARLRVGRLEDQANAAKKTYEDTIKKMGETIGDQDDLIELKRATYNHFLSKWESDNSENHGDNITPLMRAFPVTLRKYFLTEIEKDKNALV